MCFEQVKAKTEIFRYDFILFLKSKIRAIFELEYMCLFSESIFSNDGFDSFSWPIVYVYSGSY